MQTTKTQKKPLSSKKLSLPDGALNLAKHTAGLPRGNYIILLKRTDGGVFFDVVGEIATCFSEPSS